MLTLKPLEHGVDVLLTHWLPLVQVKPQGRKHGRKHPVNVLHKGVKAIAQRSEREVLQRPEFPIYDREADANEPVLKSKQSGKTVLIRCPLTKVGFQDQPSFKYLKGGRKLRLIARHLNE